ncbi:MAG: hypothetical protein EXS31_16235 [Pedosphaera sp.]|nr:hypothetical protein [Pedosphaera sp.]
MPNSKASQVGKTQLTVTLNRLLIWATHASLTLCLLAATTASAATVIPFAKTNITAGSLFRFNAPLSAHSKMVVTRGGNQAVDEAIGAIVLPPGFNPTNQYPVLIVSTTSDGDASSIGAMKRYTNMAAKVGWVVFAADGPSGKPPRDDLTWRWSMLATTLARIHEEWPASRKWPVACAGFSGGAKWSAYIGSSAMRQGYSLIGVFMGGCNEDAASIAFSYYRPGDRFKQVRFFLSSGTGDTMATPWHHVGVRRSMEKYGFKAVRLETYVGGHQLNEPHLERALQWFNEPATAVPAAKTAPKKEPAPQKPPDGEPVKEEPQDK